MHKLWLPVDAVADILVPLAALVPLYTAGVGNCGYITVKNIKDGSKESNFADAVVMAVKVELIDDMLASMSVNYTWQQLEHYVLHNKATSKTKKLKECQLWPLQGMAFGE